MFDSIFLIIIISMIVLSVLAISPADDAQNTAEIKKKIRERVHTLKHEKHGDCFFLFDAATEAFIAQGRTDDEIRTVLKARFPKHIFLVDDKHMMVGPEFYIQKIDYKVLSSLEIK